MRLSLAFHVLTCDRQRPPRLCTSQIINLNLGEFLFDCSAGTPWIGRRAECQTSAEPDVPQMVRELRSPDKAWRLEVPGQL